MTNMSMPVKVEARSVSMSGPNEQADEIPSAENDRGPYRERRGEDQQRCPAKRLAVVRLIGRVRNADVHHHLIPIASCAERHGSSWRESGGTRVTALIAEVPHEWEVDTCGLGKGAEISSAALSASALWVALSWNG